ncbi:MAG: hypothetical protein IPK73_29765 [Candidatus Obscuribacter sp.]|nr:hypothetical protein [Candidatus Obscuribacter sp.]
MAEFLGLFHRYSYIYKSKFGGEWFSAQEKWCLSDTEILKAIACEHPKFILGTRAAKASRFAVLDIDAGSKYHNSKSLEKLVATLSAPVSRSRGFTARAFLVDGTCIYFLRSR